MLETSKVTVHLPNMLLQNAMEETGKGVTETIKVALEDIARKRAYRGLLALKGTVKSKYTAAQLRGKE